MMVINNINDRNETLSVHVDDRSYRYRRIMADDKVFLYFSLPEFIEILPGAWITYQGAKYTMNKPTDFKKNHSRHYDYTLEFDSPAASLLKYRLRDVVERRLKFPLLANARQHLQMIVDNLNMRESGWTMGSCIETPAKLISYNHTTLAQALQMVADNFETEFEIVEKEISLGRIERNQSDPIALSYGKGNGFLPGVGRFNDVESAAIKVLHVQGGARNINRSSYGSPTLLLPASQSLQYEGALFEVSADGHTVSLSDAPAQSPEGSLDLADIYPSRVGEISQVIPVNPSGNFYDFVDSSIPEGLDFNDCHMPGEKMTVIFQSGMLAGREFEISAYKHALRRFEIVPAQEDGLELPSGPFVPAVGDTYAIFGIELPAAYIREDSTQSGASWDMLREAVRYLHDNSRPKFSFTGTLDGIWAKKDWLNIGGRIQLGSYVLFSDPTFEPAGVHIRIVGIKDFVNSPESPELELSNNVISSSFTSRLAKIEQNEVVTQELHRQSMSFTKRRFNDAANTISMLEQAFSNNFTKAISPAAVHTMAALVGDESLQFRFVNSTTNPQEVTHVVTYNPSTLVLNAPAGIIQHMTLGLESISPGHLASEYHFWNVTAFNSPPLSNPESSYYLYIKANKASMAASFALSESPIGFEQEAGYYHLLVGILNAELAGERSYVSLYGFTEILPGRITTNKIVSADGNTFIDLQTGDIQGKFTFRSGRDVEEVVEEVADSIEDQQIYVEYSVNGSTKWHTTFASGDIYMRQKKGNGAWSAAIRIVGEKGADGVSITLVDVEFAKNTNPTTAPTTGWTTTAPTLTGTEQLWTRIKTTYLSGNPTYSTPANITPKTGAPGAVGQGIDSVTEEYAISTSKTVQPTTGWSTTQPEWSQGQYIWSRVKIVYKNPTSTVYTGYAVSSEWEAINSIQIGGRNLVEKTNQGITNIKIDSSAGGATWTASEEIVDGVRCAKGTKNTTAVETWSLFNLWIYTPSKFRANQQYAISFKMKPSFAVNNQVTKLTTNTNQALSTNSDTYSLVAGEWNHVKLVVTTLPDFDTILAGRSTVHLRLNIVGNSSTGDTVLLKDIMIEEGNKASAYAPAPEDVDAEILSAKQEALTAAGNAQSTANSANTAVGNLSGYVDGAFKDGVIDAAEAKAIEKYKNTLNETMAKAEASYNKVYTNTYLEGTAKTSLLNAKVNLWGQKDTLLSAINTAISGGTTTPAQKTAVDSAFSTFNNLMTAFQNALEEANKAIQVKLDNISKGYVNDLEIGGTNLLKNTASGVGWSKTDFDAETRTFTRETTSTSGSFVVLINQTRLENNTTYTLSAWIKSNGQVKDVDYYVYNKGVTKTHSKRDIAVTTNWQFVTFTFTTDSSTDYSESTIRFDNNGSKTAGVNAILYVKMPKLERGTKATDWTPAPEDVPSALDYLAKAIQDGTTDVNGGLVATNVLLLKDTNGNVTAGLSGLAEDNIGFWAGGNYQGALDAIAKIVLRKDGSGQLAGGLIKMTQDGDVTIGDVHVDGGGALIVKEGADSRVFITKDDITTLDAIANSTQDTTVNNSNYSNTLYNRGTWSYNQPLPITVNNNGTRLSVTGSFGLSLQTQAGFRTSQASIEVSMWLRQEGGARGSGIYLASGSVTVNKLSGEAMTDSFNNRSLNKVAYVSAGKYYIVMDVTYMVTDEPNEEAYYNAGVYINASTMHALYDGAFQRNEIGKNGIGVIINANNYSFFGKEGGSYKSVEKVSNLTMYDKPGVLFAGSINAGGSLIGYWGAKYRIGSYREGNNIYRIHHSIGHTYYFVSLTPVLDARMWVIEKQNNYVRVQASVASLAFDFVIFGNNQ